LSLEWSRIEPQEGKFCEKEINHYAEVIAALRGRSIEPVVTLHHFTNPLWLSRIGGWENKKTISYFNRYVEYVVKTLGARVKYWVTINEPMVYTYHSYLLGRWPPQKRSFFIMNKVKNNFIAAHIRAYKTIHDIYRENKFGGCMVSFAHSMQYFMPCRPTLRNNLAVSIRDGFYNHGILKALKRNNSLDFIGMNYYSRTVVKTSSWSFESLALEGCSREHHPIERNSLGWDIYPEGLYQLLSSLKKYKLPVFILENGICTEDDSRRSAFISSHLEKVHQAMNEGLKIIGYLYWSLTDNFEWDEGYGPRFGLIEVDYNTYERRIRESAKKFAQVCKTNRIE